MQKVILEGKGVRLRDWALDDLDIYAQLLHPGHRWQKLDGPYYAKPTTNEIPGMVEKTRTHIIENNFTDSRSRPVIASRERKPHDRTSVALLD